ncbi:MAG: hypothetical protein ACRDTJ_01820 [Pseudonocardiaceae bacterium]
MDPVSDPRSVLRAVIALADELDTLTNRELRDRLLALATRAPAVPVDPDAAVEEPRDDGRRR